MSAKRFLDTNVLIYAFAQGDARSASAEDALLQGGAISVQVLNEFVNVSRRKLGLDWPQITARVEALKGLLSPILPLSVTTHDKARALAARANLGFYDALIVAAALEWGADELLSEDLQHGRKFQAMTIRNPFA